MGIAGGIRGRRERRACATTLCKAPVSAGLPKV
jgi:hypothetical protein